MYTMGLDIGSVAAKGVLFAQGEILKWDVIPTGWSPRDAANDLYNRLLNQAGLSGADLAGMVATGYGRVRVDQADKKVTEITCHAAGVHYFLPESRLIIDIGGQDSKAILVNEKGKVLNFVMNDKCAAGTGRFLQVMAATLGLEMVELNQVDPTGAVNINSMCTVFAESEVISLLAGGTPKEQIIAGLFESIARRTAGMASGLLASSRSTNAVATNGNTDAGKAEAVAFTGGVAQVAGVGKALSDALNVDIQIPQLSQLTGALGAAIIATAK